jgi:hypothetical protein
MKVEKVARTFTVDYYLQDSVHPENIKRMMKDLFKGQNKTLEQWKEAEKSIMTRRC